jgi:DNA segregation ATPase FtsK/SpoIIIE, S-DNA-T family
VREKTPNPTPTKGPELGRRHEILGILCFAAALLSGLALCSYDLQGGENWIGPLGASFASVLVTAFGLAAVLLPFELLVAAAHCVRLRVGLTGLAHAASVLVHVLLGCALLHLALRDFPVFGGHLAGGLLGELLGEVLRSIVGLTGAYVVCVSALLITLVLRTSLSVVAVTRSVFGFSATQGKGAWVTLRDGAGKLWEAWQAAKEIERQERERDRLAAEPKIKTLAGDAAAPTLDASAEGDDEEADEVDDESAADSGEDEVDDAEDEPDDVVAPAKSLAKPSQPPAPKKKGREKGPVIVAAKVETKSRGEHAPEPAKQQGPFVLPPTRLLAEAPEDTIEIDEAVLKDNAARLVEKLEAYGVKGRVDEIHPGPVVTMYEFEPQSGTKISKIAGLADDLAMALAAQKVRIVAPIPGKARVGFELPNDQRQTVYLRGLLEDERWRRMQGALPVALGKDIVGQPVYGDLAKMPHVLVAGATGSGKSVGLNVMLASLLMKKTPDEVRLLMIDPKVVELAVFDGIPHMLLPVVTDMKKASLALRWAVDEMERRYQLFADAGARNLVTYNQRVDKVISGEMSVAVFAPRRAGKVRATGVDGEEVLLSPDDGEAPDAEQWKPEKLPSIVLVVDEFADLMMVAAKDVEAAIARLAQKARAAGIHVILATQRPSVDVITGMIKANFPSRIGFKVSQREDSKTILGRTGAEHLLGMGDMLALLPGTNDLKRVHSAFISEDEVKSVCDFLRAQGEPVYDDNILKPREEDEEGGLGGSGGEPSDDPMYDRAVSVVSQAGYCSISHIQRHLSVGYNKAAKLVERMEKEGVVGPASSKAGGRREVLVSAL